MTDDERIAAAARRLAAHMDECEVCEVAERYGLMCAEGQSLSDEAVARDH